MRIINEIVFVVLIVLPVLAQAGASSTFVP